MKQLFLNVKDGSMKLIDQPMPTVKENMALVETLYTVVSAGTERGLASFGGQMAHAYTYDALYRLVSATGTYTGADNKTASYTLAMGYP